MLFLSEIYTRQELETKTKHFYDAIKANIDNTASAFENEFGLSYKLAFGTEPFELAIIKILSEYYKNEYFVREMFIKKKLLKLNETQVCKEFPVFDSRADILSINGKSIAYEIKTKYDTLKRLNKQVLNYSLCFEYVYIICPSSLKQTIEKHIPDYCGIYTYDDNRCNTDFIKVKDASKSPNLNKINILNCMLLSELDTCFKTRNKELICEEYSLSYISYIFKNCLKKRISYKWDDYKLKLQQI